MHTSPARFLVLRILLPLVLCMVPLHAAGPAAPPELSDATVAQLGKLRELTEASDYRPALALVDTLLAAAAPGSYDAALLSQIKAQILLREARYAEAIAPLENSLRTGESRGYFPEATVRDTLFLLAQLHQSRAAEAKDPAAQREALARAADYLERRRRYAPRTAPDLEQFAASLHYQRATADAGRVDFTALADARRAAEEGLVLQLDPGVNLYLVLLAVAQQREDLPAAAELLELLVARKPDNESWWRQLVATYLSQAAAAPADGRETRRLNLRALLALERAQSRGLLATPADRFNRVALLLALRRQSEGASLLEKNLADGAVENTRRNWEVLAAAYQQERRDDRALAALEKAAVALPAEGQLEFSAAQLCYAAGRLADARRHLELAVRKGRLDKPGQARLFLAYVAYEQKDYAAASAAVREARGFDDAKPADIARLEQAVSEAAKKS